MLASYKDELLNWKNRFQEASHDEKTQEQHTD